MKTFSHKIMFAVMVTYFIGVIVGGVAVLWYGGDLSAWLAFIGGVAAVAVGFYSWKSKNENVIKLSKKDIDKLQQVDRSE